MDSPHLLVFLKAPRQGEVKTRLAQSIGPAAALLAYCHLVERLLERLSVVPGVELCFSPDEAGAEIQPWRRPSWRVVPQGTGDLGTRLSRAFAVRFAAGPGPVVIIGSDCPDVCASDIGEAWAALADADVVLGPAQDGGYWLIGLRAAHPELFEAIAWGTGVVLEQTLAKAGAAGLRVHLLRTLSDVDTVTDWRRFLHQVREPSCTSATH